MLPRQTAGQNDEVGSKLFEFEPNSVPFCDPHHVVARRKVSPLLAEDLAHQALDPVPLVSPTDLAGYGDPQPRGSQRGGFGLRRDLAQGVVRNLRTHDTRRLSCGAPLSRARRHEHEKVAGVMLVAPTLDTKKLPSSA